MAKHQIGKTKSLGQRISCKGNVKKAAASAIIVDRVENTMRQALLGIQISFEAYKHPSASKTVNNILNSARQNAGNPKYGRGWTANVSAKTLKALTAQGVFA